MNRIETLIADLEGFCAYLRSRDTPARFTDALINTVEYLRQADQQAQPVGYIGKDAFDSLIRPKVYESDVAIFTSPPAQPQARELTDEEISKAFDPNELCAVEQLSAEDRLIMLEWFSRIRAVIAADRAIRPAAGMVMVPIEPTAAMLEAAANLPIQGTRGIHDRKAYKAMIAASQKEQGK